MSLSKILFLSSISFIFGVFLSSFFGILSFLIFFLFFPVFVYFSVLKDKPPLILFLILCLFGFFHYQTKILEIEKSKSNFFKNENFNFSGVLIFPPKKEEKFQDLILKTESGKVLIRTNLSQEFEFGEELEIFGKPSLAKGDYFLKDEILAIFYFPEIKKTQRNFANPFLKIIFGLKQRLEKSIEKIFNIPHAGLVEALLFGEEEKIPKDLKEKLNITNTRHICAVSGMNVTILSLFVLNFLLSLGFWRKHAFCLTVILIFLYVLMIGAPSSAIRASIMGILFLIAQYFGRISYTQRAVWFAMAMMLLFNPLLLKHDFGFQLSFLATLGLAYLYPIFLEIFKDAPKIFGFRENFCATLSAQIFVLPLLLYNFGKFSPVFIFPNILILPTLPIATALGFLSSFLAIFSLSLGKFSSYSALFFTTYIQKVVEFFSNFPHFIFEEFSLSFLILSYFLLAVFIFILNKKISQPYFLR